MEATHRQMLTLAPRKSSVCVKKILARKLGINASRVEGVESMILLTAYLIILDFQALRALLICVKVVICLQIPMSS